MKCNDWLRGTMVSLALALVIALCGASGKAQTSTAGINGTARDSSGAVIPGATITLHNQETGVERNATTNDVGNYVFLDILPGSYTLAASKAGFSAQTVPPFTLYVNQTATLDFTLSPGTVTQQVNVVAQSVQLQASTSEVGTVVTPKEVLDLPLNGRNFTQLLSLTPGAAPISVSQNAGGSFLASAIGEFVFPAINGQTNRSNYFTLDGINNLEPFNSEYVVPPIIDDIQEFKVESHNDQAEFGMALGGTVNVVTKSGTNRLHGDAWEYDRNNVFDSRDTFLPQTQVLRQNQFGATLGGPVVLPKIYNGRDRTFFFLAFQGFTFREPSSIFYRVPTPAELAGDLSDQPEQIYNPFTTVPDPSHPGEFLRTPFQNNQIPPGLISPSMLLAASILPAPIYTGVGDNNALNTTPDDQDQWEYSARIDQNLGDRNFFFFRYSGLLGNRTEANGQQNYNVAFVDRARNWGISWVHTFNPTSVMQVQFGRDATVENTLYECSILPANWNQQLGLASTFAGDYTGNVRVNPTIAVDNWFSGCGNQQNPNTPDLVWQYKGNYSKTHGKHLFKMGGELNTNGLVSVWALGGLSYNTPQTADPENLSTTGNQLASFLLDVPDGATRRNTYQTVRWGGVMGYYFSDQWKVTNRLTANLGLRYDHTFIPPYGRQIGIAGGEETGDMDFNTGNYVVQVVPPSCAARGYAPCIPGGVLPTDVVASPNKSLVHDTDLNFQPRLGLAYRLNNKTAIRTGFGVVFDNWAGVMQTTTNSFGLWPDIGIENGVNLNYPTAANPTPALTGLNPFPSGAFPPPTPFTTVGWFFDPKIKNPYSMQWNFGVQRQLNPNTTLDVSYVGSGTRRLDIGSYYNTAVTPGPGPISSREPFPYENPTYYDRSIGNGQYNALQLRLDQKLSHGLTYMVSYTWSKSMDEACSGWFGVEGCSTQDSYNIPGQRSVSAFDLTHVLNVSWVYQIPVGPGRSFSTGNRALDYVVGNWQLNGIFLGRSGQPYDVGVSGDIANTGNSGCCAGYYERLNLVGNPNLPHPTPEAWLNTAAFAPPADYTFGDVGRDEFRSDRVINLDFSLFRQFPIRESKMIEFRVEAFNIFNHPMYGIPDQDYTDPNFGKALSLASGTSPRQIQLGIKIYF